jgi:hypothetical protein
MWIDFGAGRIDPGPGVVTKKGRLRDQIKAVGQIMI